MRFVPIKTDDQLDLQALHRVRRLVHRRTALISQIRGFLRERGVVFGQTLCRREGDTAVRSCVGVGRDPYFHECK
jgi:transposase